MNAIASGHRQARAQEYECLVRIRACAFCHSTDRHIMQGTFVTP